MKALNLNMVHFILVVLVSSCSSSDQSKEVDLRNNSETVLTEKKIAQQYALKETEIKVNWTSFKFSDRVAVGGTFDQVLSKPKNSYGSVETILEKAKLDVVTSSVNSNNEVRDSKLRTYFFERWNTDTIYGEIISASNGKGRLNLTMNKINHQVKYSYHLQSDTLILSSKIDLKHWKVEDALDMLNKVCADPHTGVDGISKLWSEIEISVQLPLIEKLD